MNTINKLLPRNEVIQLIEDKKTLILAGEESILNNLPQGNWIGGTIPYFMDTGGGCIEKDQIFVTDFSDLADESRISVYTEEKVNDIVSERYSNGFSYMLIPGFSKILSAYALRALTMENLYDIPLMGWVTGIDLEDIGKVTPKVFNGTDNSKYDNAAVVLDIKIPSDKLVALEIINIFSQGDGDTIEFLEEGFKCTDCLINGEKVNLAEYIDEKNIDTRLPLVADYSGAMINISFQQVDKEEKSVLFYAPLRTGIKYKLAAPVDNYVNDFMQMVPDSDMNVISSCNCILNYLYSELDGKKTGRITGPFTFGEIAYVLVNQTMVYLSLIDN